MTYRPIAPIAINGFVPGGTPRDYPIFEDVDPCALLVDEGYQRDSSERSLKLVRKIVAGWDWAKFKAPVAVLTDAGLELIDGQHTAIAAATHPDIAKIPVMIVDVKQRRERAAAFIGQNQNKVAVTPAQLHVAALVAGDKEAQAVARVATEAGVHILRQQPGAGRYKPAETISVTAIASLIRGRGEVVAIRVLSCLARAGLAPIAQIHIKAADLRLSSRGGRERTMSNILDICLTGSDRVVIDGGFIEQTIIHSCRGEENFTHEPPIFTYFVTVHEVDGGEICLWSGLLYAEACENARDASVDWDNCAIIDRVRA